MAKNKAKGTVAASGDDTRERKGTPEKSAARASTKADKAAQKSDSASKKSAPKPQDKAAKSGIAEKVSQLREFFEESKVEIKKVTWPTRKETITTCIAVVVLTIIVSVYLGILDFGFSRVVGFILS
jgi:preprotein translocase subunit SecE